MPHNEEEAVEGLLLCWADHRRQQRWLRMPSLLFVRIVQGFARCVMDF